MPLGAARLCFLAKGAAVVVEAEVIRTKVGVIAVGNAQIDTAQSKFGGASAMFDGSGDYLVCSGDFADQIDDGDFTIECWAYIEDTGVGYILSNRRSTFGSFGWVLTHRGDTAGDPTEFYLSGYSGLGDTVLTANPTLNAWHHFAIVKSGTTVTYYVDGVSEDSLSVSGGTYAAAGSSEFRIGSNAGAGTDFDGYVDEVRISNTARYTTGFTPSTTPFVNDENTLLLLHMDGTDGSTVFEDDVGVRAKVGVTAIADAQIDTAQSNFGGSSLLLDGTGDYLVCAGGIGDLIDDGDYTVECWFRINSAETGSAYLVSNRRTTFGAFGWVLSARMDLSGDPLEMFVPGYTGQTGGDQILRAGSISADTWYHAAVVKNGTDLKLYLDGSEIDSLSLSGGTYAAAGDGNLRIGSNGAAAADTNGHIDEFRISNVARYTTGFTPSTTPFVNDDNTLLLLHMDGTDGSTYFEDDNGVRAKVGMVAIADAQIDTAQSKFGGASALFDGTGDYLTAVGPVWNDYLDNTVTYTIEGWFRFADTGTRRMLFGNRNNFNTTNGMSVEWSAITSGKFRIFSSTFTIESTNSFSTGTWYHVALVRNLTSVKLYIDGVEECSGTLGFNDNTANNDFYIGWSGYAGQNPHNGHIDEFRFSNTVRYSTGFTPSTTPFQNDSNTLLLLHMDGTDGSTVFTDDNGVPPDHEY